MVCFVLCLESPTAALSCLNVDVPRWTQSAGVSFWRLFCSPPSISSRQAFLPSRGNHVWQGWESFEASPNLTNQMLTGAALQLFPLGTLEPYPPWISWGEDHDISAYSNPSNRAKIGTSQRLLFLIKAEFIISPDTKVTSVYFECLISFEAICMCRHYKSKPSYPLHRCILRV